MKYQGNLRLLGQFRMATGEHHAKQVVFDGVSGKELRNSGSQCPLTFHEPSELRRKGTGRALATEHLEAHGSSRWPSTTRTDSPVCHGTSIPLTPDKRRLVRRPGPTRG